MWCEVESKDMTDAQMVEKVAREVMGFDVRMMECTSVVYSDDEGFRDVFSPLTDANDTQMIKNRLREMGWIIIIGLQQNSVTVTLWREGLRELLTVNADTESRAICEAAMEAVENGG
jgi:non-ribosomal peptide synthetase component F